MLSTNKITLTEEQKKFFKSCIGKKDYIIIGNENDLYIFIKIIK